MKQFENNKKHIVSFKKHIHFSFLTIRSKQGKTNYGSTNDKGHEAI